MKYCPSCLKCFEDTFGLCADDRSALVEAPPRAPVIAGKYRIERLISRGPNLVYEGTQVETERPVAVKLILAGAGAPEPVRRKALAVACVSTRVDHQHVAKTCDYGQLPDGIAYVVTELVYGRTLREHLDGGGRLSAAEAARVARQVADGLEAAHVRGVVHGGLNPSNVILARDYHGRPDAKIINFGLSECRVQPSGGVTPTDPDEVRRYLSPEQLSGRAADARSDVYSLGVVLHEMLTGRAGPVAELGERSGQQETCCEQVPGPLLSLLSDALHEKPSARLQSAAEFARRLRFVECPEAAATPGGPLPAPSVPDRQAPSELPDLPLQSDDEALAAPAPVARPPARKIGFLDDYADDPPVGHAYPRGISPSPDKDVATHVVEHDGAAAQGRRQRPAQLRSRGRSERPVVLNPRATLSSGPPQTHAHRSFAVAVPALLILALGTLGWLASRPPPSPDEAATRVQMPGSRLTEAKLPESVAARERTFQEDAATPTDDGRRTSSGDGLQLSGGEARKRLGSRAPGDVIIDRQESPVEEAMTGAAVRPRRVTPEPALAGRERGPDAGCALTTSRGTVTLPRDGGSGEIAVGLVNRPAGPAAVTAATGDWSDIAVLAASPGAGGGGVSVYRIVSVSKRAGTYHVRFNSACGARRVVVKVE